MVWLIGFRVIIREIWMIEIVKKLINQQENTDILFKDCQLANGSSESNKSIVFLQRA